MEKPHHVTTANITQSILRDIYPQMEQRSEEYTKKYRAVSNLRNLGQRLDLLVASFWYGSRFSSRRDRNLYFRAVSRHQ